MNKLNIRTLAGEIRAEISMASNFGEIPENDQIDVALLQRLNAFDYRCLGAFTDVAVAVLARHCGEQLVNCDEMPVTPLAKRKFPGDDDDDDYDDG